MKATDAKSAGSPAAWSPAAPWPRLAGDPRADLDRPVIAVHAAGAPPQPARACGGGVPRKCADVSAAGSPTRNAELRRTGAGGAERSKYAAPGRGEITAIWFDEAGELFTLDGVVAAQLSSAANHDEAVKQATILGFRFYVWPGRNRHERRVARAKGERA